MKSLIQVLLVLILIAIAVPARCLERFDIITTEELEKMLSNREAGRIDFVLVNTLDEIIFRHAAIPGSVSIPWSRVDETIQRAGEDKNKLLILY